MKQSKLVVDKAEPLGDGSYIVSAKDSSNQLQHTLFYSVKNYKNLYCIGILDDNYYVYSIKGKIILTVYYKGARKKAIDGYVSLCKEGITRQLSIKQLYLDSLPTTRSSFKVLGRLKKETT